MPAEVLVERQQQIPIQQLEVHRAVREMRGLVIPPLTLKKLARAAGSSAAALCMWERGLGRLRRSQQLAVLRVVRREFALYTARVVELAQRHGVRPGVS
jgi:hypothetical protein